MTDREKIAHVLRRLGLGAGKSEVDRYLPLGVEGTIDKLTQYENVPEGFPVQPYEFTVYDAGLMVDPAKFASWWALRMVMTQRPLQERLTLFWHDHFAVSAAKVFEGPSMLNYLNTLRDHAGGNFRKLTHAVSKQSAMIYYLDTQTSTPEHPNENFARELMELFTMGSGYTEKDVQEGARSFTGWALFYAAFGDDRPGDKLREDYARKKRSLFEFCEVPALYDTGSKTFLGKTGPFHGDDIIDIVLDRPETCRFVTSKLAQFFLGKPPSSKLAESLAKEFAKTYEIMPIVRQVIASDEFWDAPHSIPKSPVDFTVAIFRQLNLKPVLDAFYPATRDPWTPLRPELRGIGDGALYLMSQQGMLLLYPPDVSGWNWGKGWINSNAMAVRMNMGNILFRGDDPNRPIAAMIAGRLATEFRVASNEDIVSAFLSMFDGEHVPDSAKLALGEIAKKHDAIKNLSDKEKNSLFVAELARTLYAVPEFQLC